jgi:hypothetical protein
MGFLEREGSGRHALYRNTDEAAVYLDRRSAAYIGGILETANERLYASWGRLTEALKTGQAPVSPAGACEPGPMLDDLCGQPPVLQQLAERFDFGRRLTLADVGGGIGRLACTVAARHPRLRATTLDRPALAPLARRHVEGCGLSSRVAVRPLDILTDPFPPADVVALGRGLHRWSLERKLLLMRKAHDALPDGGCLIALDLLIDDERRRSDCGLLMSLNMLVECGDGFDYSGADFASWARSLGFSGTEVIPLAGPAAAAVAYK